MTEARSVLLVTMAKFTLFYAYAQEDERFRKKLDKHLSFMVNQGLIAPWSHQDINAGTLRDQELSEHLRTADIILLLVSANFLPSDWADTSHSGQARVIPILLQPCDWEHAPFATLEVLPDNRRPVTLWSNEDAAFTNIAKGIRKVVDELNGTEDTRHGQNSAPADGGSKQGEAQPLQAPILEEMTEGKKKHTKRGNVGRRDITPGSQSIDNESDNKSNNPFYFYGPLPHDSMVYLKRGRDVEDKALQLLERMDWFSINGPRQCGKTSLIFWLRDHKQLLDVGYSFASVDMSMLANIPDVTEEKWYGTLQTSLLTQITGSYAQVFPPRDPDTRATGTHFVHLFNSKDKWPSAPTDSDSWRQFLSDLADCAVKAKQRLVIVFDRVTPSNLQRVWISGCFRALRNILDTRRVDDSLRSLAFVLVGTYDVDDLISSSNDSSLDLPRIDLPDFSEELVEELVKKLVTHLKLSTEETLRITDCIYYWTAGHPYLTQLLCYHLAESHKPLTVKTVNDIVARLCTMRLAHFSAPLRALHDPNLRTWIERLLRGDEFRLSDFHPDHLRLKHLGLIKPGDVSKCMIRNQLYKKLLEDNFEVIGTENR